MEREITLNSDTKWSAISALVHAAASITQSVFERRKPPSNDPSLHERVAVLETKVERLQSVEGKT